VTAIEIDRELFPVLQAVTEPFENVRLVAGDVLKIPVETLFAVSGYKVVANIPYYITSAVIRHLLEAKVRPERVVLTMQREVAERILSSDEKMSLLSLSVQIYGQARIASQIPAACFIPEPKVDSSVLVVDIYPEPKLSGEQVDLLFRLAHAAFNQKRKMLRNSLQPVLGGDSEVVSVKLQEVGINPQARPENLALDEWIKLVDVCKD
jgi:16S rRNA (adenine1518-N6/adenine1519-N6)-dimethyltransferase